MRFLRDHPLMVTGVAIAIAAVAVAAIAAAYGFGAFADAWSHLSPVWIVLCLAGQLLSIPAYAFAYRAIAHHQGGPLLRPRLLARIVVAGFGPFTARGGFALDKRALHAIDGDEEEAVVRVLGLGALEWILLAPAACLAAIALLVDGDPRPMPSVLWPWALAMPIGFAVLALVVHPRIEPLLTAADQGRTPAHEERLIAAAPFGGG